MKFPIPVTAINLMFEFTVVKSNNYSAKIKRSQGLFGGGGEGYDRWGYSAFNPPSHQVPTFNTERKENLICPRCNIPVENDHGNCPSCGENAQQCPFCRNINFGNLESFFCIECGKSKHGTYEFKLQLKPGHIVQKIVDESTLKDSEDQLEQHLQNAQIGYTKIQLKREEMNETLRAVNDTAPPKTRLVQHEFLIDGRGDSATDIIAQHQEAKDIYKQLMKNLIDSKNIRQEILRYRGNQQTEDEENKGTLIDQLFDGQCMEVDLEEKKVVQ